jgi:hypothetical protein
MRPIPFNDPAHLIAHCVDLIHRLDLRSDQLLRETFNPLAMAQAQLPNGVADIEPPGDDVHSF